jgi:hypothetical protein
MKINLTPVTHDCDCELVRVPARLVGGCYTIYVADWYQRNFDADTLPDVLKSKFAMILASPDVLLQPDHELYELELYTNTTMSPEFNNIGWRASETYFCLILTREFLMSLKGG